MYCTSRNTPLVVELSDDADCSSGWIMSADMILRNSARGEVLGAPSAICADRVVGTDETPLYRWTGNYQTPLSLDGNLIAAN